MDHAGSILSFVYRAVSIDGLSYIKINLHKGAQNEILKYVGECLNKTFTLKWEHHQ